MSAITLCSLVLEFEPDNTKALFMRAKAALSLHNFRQVVCDLREATRIEPNNSKIAKELAKAESTDCHNEISNKYLEESKHKVNDVEECWGSLQQGTRSQTLSNVKN